MNQRQVIVESLDGEGLRLSAPNLETHEVALRQSSGANGWTAKLYRLGASDEDKEQVAETESMPNAQAACEAAYELFRRHVIVGNS